jgi:hypothetical protein
MMRHTLTLAGMLFVVWLVMMLGCWVIDGVVVPIRLHDVVLTGVVKVLVSASLIMVWLALWRQMVFGYFNTLIKRKG